MYAQILQELRALKSQRDFFASINPKKYPGGFKAYQKEFSKLNYEILTKTAELEYLNN